MDFLDQFFEKHGTRAPRPHDEHGRHTARPHRDPSHDEPRYAYTPGVFGGVLAVLLMLSLLGTFGTLVGIQDLAARRGELPRLVNTLLVDVPKAVLDDLAPLLQLKSTLEGNA